MKNEDTDATMVRVVWRDAHADAERWYDLADLQTGGPLLVTTVGVMLKGKADHLTIVQSITSEFCVDHPLFIPNENVISVQELGLVEKPAKRKGS